MPASEIGYPMVYFLDEKDKTIQSAKIRETLPAISQKKSVILYCNGFMVEKSPADLYPSYEAATEARCALETTVYESYISQTRNKEDLLRFIYNTNICWFDRLTDWTARKVVQEQARNLLDVYLHTKSGTHSFQRRKTRLSVPIGSRIYMLDSRNGIVIPGTLLSYMRDDQRTFARILEKHTQHENVVPAEWIFTSRDEAEMHMPERMDQEYRRCCQEIREEKDLYIFGYSHPVSLECACLNLAARRAFHDRAFQLLGVDLNRA